MFVVSLPGSMGKVIFSHYLASVVRRRSRPASCVRRLLTFTKLFSSETFGPNLTKLGYNYH